jgi:hypothetical protein
VLALGLMGCSETSGTGGGGQGGDGGTGGMTGQEFPCTEQGIRDAIAEGGGPHTFDCDGTTPTPVMVEAEIVIDNDVALDGEGDLDVQGNAERVFVVADGVTAELRNLQVSVASAPDRDALGISNMGILALVHSGVGGVNGGTSSNQEYGISNKGTLTMNNSGVGGMQDIGIRNEGTMTLMDSLLEFNGVAISQLSGVATLSRSNIVENSVGVIAASGTITFTASTVADNTEGFDEVGGGSGIANMATVTLLNSTVSGNAGDCAIANGGNMIVTSSTVSSDEDSSGSVICNSETLTLASSVVDGRCDGSNITSNGYNIESPGNTCGFDPGGTDQVNVSADDLNLGPLSFNGGPNWTHALLTGSVAIDVIPVEDCVDADGEALLTDQRGQPRPETGGTMCDVGSVESEQFCKTFTNQEAACYPACEQAISSGGDRWACADGLVSVADCLEDNDCTTDTCEAEWQAWASDCLGGP